MCLKGHLDCRWIVQEQSGSGWSVRLLVVVQVRDNGGLDWVLSNGDGVKRTDPGTTLEVELSNPLKRAPPSTMIIMPARVGEPKG